MILSLKKMFIVSIVIVLIGATATLGLEMMTIAPSTEASPDEEIISETVFDETFKLSMLLNKTTYALGEPVKITLTLTNVREENVTFVFLTGPNPSPYWFWRVYDENDRIVFYHEYVLMIPTLEEITLQPAELMQGRYTWNQKDTNNEQQVPPGIYYPTATVGFMYNGEEVLLETRIKIYIES